MHFEIVISGPGFEDTAHAFRPGMQLAIGSALESDILLTAPEGVNIAGRHFVLRNDEGTCQITAEGGAVTLNGRSIAQGSEVQLAEGDLLEIGPWRLRLCAVTVFGADGFEKLLSKPFGATKDEPVKTPALDSLRPAKSEPGLPRNPGKTDAGDFLDDPLPAKPAAPVVPKHPDRPNTDATKDRPAPSTPGEFEVPPHLRAKKNPDAARPNSPFAWPPAKVSPPPRIPTSPLGFPGARPRLSPLDRPPPRPGFAPSGEPQHGRSPPNPDDWADEAEPQRPTPPAPSAPPREGVGLREIGEALDHPTPPEKPREMGAGGREAPTPAIAPRGHALFRVPRLMWTEVAELAELRLAHGDPMTVAMRAELERTMVGRGHRTDEHPVARIGSRMQARLHGDDRFFEIAPLGSEAQDIAPGDTAKWDWRVTPLCEGYSLLTLRLTMLADMEGHEVTVDAEALHTSVEITVKSFFTRPRRFLRDNWRWILGSSGIGAAAALYALYKVITGD